MITPFEPAHLLSLDFQERQTTQQQTPEHAATLAGGYRAMTSWHAGQPRACAGLIELWPGRALAWAALDKTAHRGLVEITRRMHEELVAAPFRRIELYTSPYFPEAIRWAYMLGFSLETTMVEGAAEGGDLLVFTRIRRSAAAQLRG